jgi:hypothetical protein
MALSPAAWIGLFAGVVMVTRRLDLASGRVLRYLSRLAVLATAAAVVFLVCASVWMLGRQPVEADLFRPGLVDGAELLVMALALIVAVRVGPAMRTARLALPARR